MDIIRDITGRIPGNIIIMAYFLLFIFLWAVYIRQFVERILSTVMPSSSIDIIIISMLVVVAIAIHSGITVIARMNEIIFAVTMIVMGILFLFALPIFKIKNITPVYYTDILPAFLGSAIFWNLYGYLIVFFFFGAQINEKDKLANLGIKASAFLTLFATSTIVLTIGTQGYTFVERAPRPTFSFIKQISILGVIERLESAVVILWLTSDFIIISVFTYAILSIINDFFKLSSYKPLIIPLLTLGYFLSLLIVTNIFEFELRTNYVIAISVFMEYVIPLLLLLVGKVRKKI